VGIFCEIFNFLLEAEITLLLVELGDNFKNNNDFLNSHSTVIIYYENKKGESAF